MNPDAARTNLGPKITTFRGRPIILRTWILLLIPGCLLIFASYFYGMLLAGDAYQNYGPVLAYIRSRSWFIFATLMLILLAAYFLYLLLLSALRFEVYKNGVRYRSLLLLSHTYSWSEISGISSSATKTTFFGKEIRTIPSGKIFFNNGKSIDLTNKIQNLPRLVSIVKSKIYPLIWPTLKSLLRSGGTAQFGRLQLTQENILIAKKKIPWILVEGLSVDSGFLVVNLRDATNQFVPISKIPNLELLLKLVDWGVHT